MRSRRGHWPPFCCPAKALARSGIPACPAFDCASHSRNPPPLVAVLLPTSGCAACLVGRICCIRGATRSQPTLVRTEVSLCFPDHVEMGWTLRSHGAGSGGG